MIKIIAEYVDTIPKDFLAAFNELVNTEDDSYINEAFVRFSTLGSGKIRNAEKRLKDEALAIKQILTEGAQDLAYAELIPGTRKTRVDDIFRQTKDDIVKRYKTITGEI